MEQDQIGVFREMLEELAAEWGFVGTVGLFQNGAPLCCIPFGEKETPPVMDDAARLLEELAEDGLSPEENAGLLVCGIGDEAEAGLLAWDPAADAAFAVLGEAEDPGYFEDGRFRCFENDLRDLFLSAITFPEAPALVPYGEENMNDAMNLRIAPDQQGFVISPARCLARAYGLGDHAAAFVLMEGKRAIGLATLLGAPDNEIDALLIDERYQGRGYGKILVQLCVEEYRRRGVPAVTAATASDNGSALTLYESMGFRITAADDTETVLMLNL